MKKKIAALILTATAVLSVTAMTQTSQASTTATVNESGNVVVSGEGSRVILSCYDETGKLVYNNIYPKNESGSFEMNIPQEYKDLTKRVYFVETKEFSDVIIQDVPDSTPAPTATPSPSETAKPEPTKTPSSKPSIYEKETDAIYAPALVKDVETQTNSDGEDIYAVTVFYQGREMTIGIEEDLTISTAPQEYEFMEGKRMDSLQRGDVMCMTANIAGDTIRTVDFVFRPTAEDIATGDEDFGESFEKLFSANGSVAGKWSVMEYGASSSSDRYEYAFGIVGKKDNNTLTLINKSGDEDTALEIDIQNDTIVYVCNVDGKEYDVELADTSGIETTIPNNAFNNGPVDLNDDYSYNYALVRLVDKTATEVILYNNYNK